MKTNSTSVTDNPKKLILLIGIPLLPTLSLALLFGKSKQQTGVEQYPSEGEVIEEEFDDEELLPEEITEDITEEDITEESPEQFPQEPEDQSQALEQSKNEF